LLSLSQKSFGIFGNVRHQASAVAHGSLFYNWLLSKGQTPSHLQVKLADPWPGQMDVGRMMNRGVLMHQGITIKIDADFWKNASQNIGHIEIVHGFSWLRDLRAAGGDASRKLARQLVEEWLNQFDKCDPVIWRPDIMGQRIIMWISFFDFFCGSADEEFQCKYFNSLVKQTRHLARSISNGLYGIPLLKAAEGLVYAGLSLSEEDNWTLKGFEIILREVPKQIRKDGTHISGSPESILKCTQILLDLRYALNKASLPVPQIIHTALENMGTALRFFSYPDHRLALFHGGQKAESYTIDTALSQIRNTKRPLKDASVGGFERVTKGRAVLMIDTGSVPDFPYNKNYHSAPLAFEFTYGRDRVFTNCGGHPFDINWQQGLRHTAAHNSLCVNNKPVHDFLSSGEVVKPHGPICSMRRENKETTLIDVSHDAYRAAHGIDHKRRFFLSQQGEDFRGEDTLLSRVALAKPLPVSIRFHLHPRVQIVRLEEDGSIILTLPAGSSWKFCAVGAQSTLEASVFLGVGVKPTKTRQIILTTDMIGDECKVKWALQRI
jgi:uncharacterized heparinase superfamily protein